MDKGMGMGMAMARSLGAHVWSIKTYHLGQLVTAPAQATGEPETTQQRRRAVVPVRVHRRLRQTFDHGWA